MNETPSSRLKKAMDRKGISAAELSRRTGVKEVTVRAAANGTQGVTKAKAEIYAPHLDVDPEWIMFGRGKGPGAQPGKPKLTQVYGLPEAIPATERAHLIRFINALAARDPAAVDFIQADMEAVAEAESLGIQGPLSASERGGLISSKASLREQVATHQPGAAKKPISAVKKR